ncbi:MAG: lysine--tRNA ligase [Chloroflexi bacterium]|jgi:lysyl-tRNA synthetase class 2|nr:lysine--tRNA ligase [Chloroflexota bacterium]
MAEITDRREQRIAKMERLRERGIDPYPARVTYSHTTAQAIRAYEEAAAADGDEQVDLDVQVVGRLVAVRIMGKSSFAHIADGSGRLQLYLRRDVVGEDTYETFRRDLDIGDFVWAEGHLFRTRSGEISVEVRALRVLSKALRGMPEKWHGLRDVETRYRQRYLDLMANAETQEIFRKRTRIVSEIRRYLDAQGFLEVETPILQPIYGGAAARPFTTYHNALDQTLYLRIADELYLKRLIIGGFDRVYEIGHNFRNEGISTQHNPEFTLIEVYQAYADYADIMRMVEELWSTVAINVLGSAKVTYQGQEIDLTPPWKRITMRDVILEACGVDIEAHQDLEALWQAAQDRGLTVRQQPTWGRMVDELFSEYAEPRLIQPTFVTDYPVEISPLAKKKPEAPHLVERFEFFMCGMECGNAFSELNDPLDQRERFEEQRRASDLGDDEAHPMDEDFITALEHGMPPTGGLGFGIDRMVMLLTDQASIREVILFPHLRNLTE